MMEWFVKNFRKSQSLPVKALATGVFPMQFFNSFYSLKELGAGEMKESVFSLSFDVDHKIDNEVLPKLLDVLSSYKMKCDFAAIGKWVEQYPRVYSSILDNGHDLINHTYTHPDNSELSPNVYFKDLPPNKKKEEILKCHEAVKNATGYEMKGYRTPHFGNQYTQDIYPILEELGHSFSSSVIAARAEKFVPYKVGKITEFPITICPKHPLSSFDSFHVIRAKKHTPQEFLSLFKFLLEKAKKERLFINLYFDPQDVASLQEFEKMLEAVSSEKEIRKSKLAELVK
ncbi:MAG: polysaccharide deacetylase family protein [Candidatus Micrarchaeota archaeon]|nr:polysaccharide deacetylase family protein [Candidatus Micrarchaeota archaeon]